MRNLLLLYNHRSGRGKIVRKLSRVIEIFTDYGYTVTPYEINFNENPFDKFAQMDAAVIAGGDGTINFVINSMINRGLDIPLGLIPVGTANDFSRAIGMSRNIITASCQIAAGRTRRVDCGKVNSMHFINVLSFGAFTTTSQKTPDKIKHAIGKLAYTTKGAQEIFSIHPIPLKINADGRITQLNALTVLIFNGKRAGGLPFAKSARVDDGYLDCIVLRRRNFFTTVLEFIPHLMGLQSTNVSHIRAKKFLFTTPADEPTDVDGQKGADFPLRVECLNGRLQIISPQK